MNDFIPGSQTVVRVNLSKWELAVMTGGDRKRT